MADKIFALRTLLIIYVSFMFLSCEGFFSTSIHSDHSSGNFWATNFITDRDYRVKAELLAEGVHCKVWVEKGIGVGRTQARIIADKFDEKIYVLMVNAFGIENPSNPSFNGGRPFSDIMAFADYLGDNDGKLCILLLDIKDGYRAGVNESYIAGYFWGGDFYSPFEAPGSNQRDMIYIDTYPGMVGDDYEGVFTTLAHEMQHMINFVTRVIKDSDTLMDTWIDEGLSSAAEYIISDGTHLSDRIDWYNENGSNRTNINGLIDQGNNFFIWDNHTTDRNPYPVLDDYATVYLFFQWLRLQKGDNIYRDIISSNYCDYQAVENAAGEDWDILLKNWLAANYINDSTGEYGYKGDISDIVVHMAPAGSTEFRLYPGEGVYSPTDDGDTMPLQGTRGPNIRYAGLDKTEGVSDSTVFPGGVLLTYNINTAIDGIAEIGITTGRAANVIITLMNRSVISSSSRPYRIGAGDVHSRNGKKRDFPPWNIQAK